jgi:hypothetical protein
VIWGLISLPQWNLKTVAVLQCANIFTPRRNDWNQALWISAHYVCILLLIRYYCFNDFALAVAEIRSFQPFVARQQ